MAGFEWIADVLSKFEYACHLAVCVCNRRLKHLFLISVAQFRPGELTTTGAA